MAGAPGTHSLRDQLGHVSEDRVGLATCSGNTVSTINVDTSLSSDVYDIATKATLHPAFQD